MASMTFLAIPGFDLSTVEVVSVWPKFGKTYISKCKKRKKCKVNVRKCKTSHVTFPVIKHKLLMKITVIISSNW